MSKRVAVVYREAAKLAPYEAALAAAGVEPGSILAGTNVSLQGYSGLLLTGGSDVNPLRYGETVQPETEAPDDERDAMEVSLIRAALARDLPLLAICRGLQIFNVSQGGTLVQHLKTSGRHKNTSGDRSQPAHEVTVEPDTLLASIAGSLTWRVNSRHHQAVARVGSGLIISARDSEDGTIEALEMPGKRFVLAVQWHPEDQAPADSEQAKLFQSFAAAL